MNQYEDKEHIGLLLVLILITGLGTIVLTLILSLFTPSDKDPTGPIYREVKNSDGSSYKIYYPNYYSCKSDRTYLVNGIVEVSPCKRTK